jgi:two-component system, OmpR family, sensor histidine kinase ChvG
VRSIRWKLLLLCAAGMLAPVLLLNHYSIRAFDRFASRDMEEHMIDSAFIVGERYKEALDDAGSLPAERAAHLGETVCAYGREIEARIQVLSPRGEVLVDSETNGVLQADLSSQPEVVAATEGKYRARFAMTDDHLLMFYFVAYPVKSGAKVLGVVRITRNTNRIMRVILQMTRFQRATTAAAIAVGLILAALLAHSITGRLRVLTSAATAFAAGEGPLKVGIRGRDEVAQLGHAVTRMAAEIQRTNAYNREFVSTVLHELKMPITAIKGAAELLQHGAADDKTVRDKFLGNICFEADRLARLVGELNELTKLDAQTFHAPKQKVDYGSAVKEMVERFEAALDPDHARLHVTVPEVPVFAKILPGRMEQVLDNLLENALRYTPASGRIDVTVESAPDNSLLTTVRDTGCGIAASNLPKVFDRFFTTEPKDQPRSYGSGLGLAIAKSIVENHQGKIWVESTVGAGTAFFFTLPSSVG